MSTQIPDVKSDDALLRLAETVLTERGYQTEFVHDEPNLVLAENSYFVVAVVASNTIRELIHSEGVAEGTFTRRIESSSLGPKKWDTYLVLLTQERSPENDDVTRDLYAINYDTSRLRRIAHTGVDPTVEAVGQALASFVPPETAPAQVQGDEFAALLKALTSRGVDEQFAQRAIRAFGQGAQLDDVL